MPERTRRLSLRLAAAYPGTGLAGCLNGTPGATDAPKDEPTATDGGSPTGTPGDVTAETLHLGTRFARPDWADHHVGHVALYASASAARAGLDLDAADDDSREAVASFLDATDFETDRLLYVASSGPDTCHDTVELSGLGVADGTLIGAATVTTGDDGGACGDAVTYPAALARVRFTGDPAGEARITVTDGWDESEELRATAVGNVVDPDSLPGHVRPETDPATVPAALSCEDDGFVRVGTGYSGDPPWGKTDSHDWGTFALRVDRRSVVPGEAVTVTLTNLGPGKGTTGNRHKYSLQVLTEAGYQEVRGYPDGDRRGYTDEALRHDTGKGFEWSFEMTPEGVVAGHVHGDAVTVCPGLPAGRYRFVFWEPTVAVAFDLTG